MKSKRLLSLILSVIFSGSLYITAYADNHETNGVPVFHSGTPETFQFVEMSQKEAEKADDALADYYARLESTPMTTAVNNSYFDYDYRSDYVYAQLNATDKKFYSELYDSCLTFALSTIDLEADSDSEYSYSYFGTAECDRIYFLDNRQHLSDLASQFMYANPQFYFTWWWCGYSYSNDPDTVKIYFVCNPDFVKYSARREWTDKIHSKTDDWLSVINSGQNQLEKVISIYTLMCENIVYDDSMGNDYDQTIAGSIGAGRSVCAGYTKAFNYFCHLSGIKSIAVHGIGHAWNMVCLFGDWYIIDVTWMDQDWGIYYPWCLKSTEYCEKYGYNSGMHTLDAIYDENTGFIVLPLCLKDTVEVPEFVIGDLDGNYELGMPDLTLLAYRVSDPGSAYTEVGDMNEDGKISMEDLTLLSYKISSGK